MLHHLARSVRNKLQDTHGLSIVELMVAAALIGATLVAALPNLHRYNANRRVEQAAGRVESALKRARSLAVTRQVNVRVAVDPTSGSVVLQRDDDDNGSFETQVFSEVLPRHVEFTSGGFAGSNQVVFNRRGIPSNAGAVRFQFPGAGTQELRLASGSGSVTVFTIHPEEP